MSFKNLNMERILKFAGVERITEEKTFKSVDEMLRSLLAALTALEQAMSDDKNEYAEQLADIIKHFKGSKVKT